MSWSTSTPRSVKTADLKDASAFTQVDLTTEADAQRNACQQAAALLAGTLGNGKVVVNMGGTEGDSVWVNVAVLDEDPVETQEVAIAEEVADNG